MDWRVSDAVGVGLFADRLDGIKTDRLDGRPALGATMDRDKMLDAAETVIARDGIGDVTLDAVAAAAGISKGGLLHHFPSKDALVQALVIRCAESWRTKYMEAHANTPDGPGRMARALITYCLTDADTWTDQLRRMGSSVFAALAQNPALIQPMRAVYADLHRRVAEDGLPPGVGEAIVAATDGLWLDWVLGLVPVNQALLDRVRPALEGMLARSMHARPPRKRKAAVKRAGGRRR